MRFKTILLEDLSFIGARMLMDSFIETNLCCMEVCVRIASRLAQFRDNPGQSAYQSLVLGGLCRRALLSGFGNDGALSFCGNTWVLTGNVDRLVADVEQSS